MEITAILLAAGAGSRFGGDKLLHPLSDGVAIGARAARNLIAAGLDVVAVVKHGDFPLADVLEQEGCQVTMFADAARGMGASLAHGVAQRRSADGWIVALADMPGIKSDTITMVVRELAAGRELVAPTYLGQRGHPVGWGKRFGSQLIALGGDAGARDIIAAHKNELVVIECGDPGVLHDIDRLDDLAK
ncbi:MAG: molybdopterin-guanine dinucleotide biosynthesis protein MobA [Betaproteobacteria bacterium]|nr:molybdopterin-guanine dinucleotide biosynthesis protein MobA [Betaproteobacteria bacterium]